MADTTLYKQIVLEWGQDTDSLIWGMGYSPDNGEHFYVLNTTYGRKYRIEDGGRIWPFLVDKVKAVLDWSAITNKPDVALKSDLTWSSITNKPDLALKTDLTWSNVTGKPDVALKSDVAAVSAVASSASDKADSNAKLIAGKAGQADLDNVSKTASSALDKATSNANALAGKVNKADLTWTNITNRPDFDKVASQASQAVVTANTAESQASAAGQAAASASTQASAAKTTADTATATANAAKASASTASATAASAQQIANSASASASATAVALKSKADTATVNAQFTAVNSNVASAQATADSAVAGLAGKLDKTALTWGNVAGKPTNLATTESVAKAQSAADSAVGVANGAVATANSAKSMATSAAGVANTANATANSALTKANSASTVASQANSTATQASQSASNAVSVANQAKNTANTASATATQAKSTADNVNNRLWSIQANGGGRNLLHGTSGDWITKTATSWMNVTTANSNKTSVADYRTGDKFTYSAMVLNKSNVNVSLELYCCDNNGNRLNGDSHHALSDYVAPNTTAKRISCTITIDSNTWYVEHTLIADGGTSTSKTVQIKGEMFEYGTVAHDWSPAPEDIQSEIDANSALIKSNTTEIGNAKTAAANAQSSANSAQSTANTAKSTADSALSKANSNATTLNNKVNKSDLTWANISGKPSIPNADDTTTVSSGDLNNYTTTGKYYMPNALSNYTNHPTTGTDMGDWFVMKVDAYHSGDMIVQTIYQINSGDVWIRQRWSGAWKSWRQINFWG